MILYVKIGQVHIIIATMTIIIIIIIMNMNSQLAWWELDNNRNTLGMVG